MKLALTLGTTLALLSLPALAASHGPVHPLTQGNLSFPNPFAALLPKASGGTSAASTFAIPVDDTTGVLSALVKVKGQVVADIQSADALANTTIPSGTKLADGTVSDGTATWDPIAHACYPTLISFIDSLPGVDQLPVPSGQGGLVTVAEQGRIAIIAANMAINNINAVGYPNSLKLACDPLILDTLAGAGIQGTVIGVNTLLLKFIPAAAALVPKIP